MGAADQGLFPEIASWDKMPDPEQRAPSIPILLIEVADERLSFEVNRPGIEKLSDAQWSELCRNVSEVLVELKQRRARIRKHAQGSVRWMQLGVIGGCIGGASLGVYELTLLMLGEMSGRFSSWSTPVLKLFLGLPRPEHDAETILILGFFFATVAFTGAMGTIHGMLFAVFMARGKRRGWAVGFGVCYGLLVCLVYFLATTDLTSVFPPFQEVIGFVVFGSILGFSFAGNAQRRWPSSIARLRSA